MECKKLFEIMESGGKKGSERELNYREFFYNKTFYLIDPKKLDFTLNILKTDKTTFFEIENLKKFLNEYELLSEEFLEFISITHKKVEF